MEKELITPSGTRIKLIGEKEEVEPIFSKKKQDFKGNIKNHT